MAVIFRVIESKSFDVYRNLAIEDFLVNQYCQRGDILLYLWQNDKSVVLGRNQSAYSECNLEFARNNNISISRRLSGGGAVFHDKGNLNYTFVASNDLFARETFCRIIIQSLINCGLNAELTGRNDIHIDGMKVSGMACYEGKDCSFLHGCLMVNVNEDMLAKILTPRLEKLESKGIPSIRARVRNIAGFQKILSEEILKERIIQVSREMLDSSDMTEPLSIIDAISLPVGDDLLDKYRSESWIFGRNIPVTIRLSENFDWGGCDVEIGVERGVISEVMIYTDALETGIFHVISRELKGCALRKKAMIQRLEKICVQDYPKRIVLDFERLVQERMNINE